MGLHIIQKSQQAGTRQGRQGFFLFLKGDGGGKVSSRPQETKQFIARLCLLAVIAHGFQNEAEYRRCEERHRKREQTLQSINLTCKSRPSIDFTSATRRIKDLL